MPLAEITPIVGESRSCSVSRQKGLTISYFTFSHTSVVMLILPSRALGAGCVV